MIALRDLPLVIDGFAGPGGWDEGVRPLGLRPRGIDLDETACATARAAGHYRHRADMAATDPRATVAVWGRCRGQIHSAPCQGFSKAGKAHGIGDRELLLDAVASIRTASDASDAIAKLHANMRDDRSTLVLEPLRWALTLTPSWLAWEQVHTVLPVWEACAEVLRRLGYSVVTRSVRAEQYGVPQTRTRAILLARAPWFADEHGPARFPAPTHSQFHLRNPARLDPGVLPWVTIADALGMDPSEPIELASTTRDNSPRRRLWQPAQTMAFGNDAASCVFLPVGANVREAKLDGSARRITHAEASVLQTFPRDYPWQGPVAVRYRQIGDAVPPLLARRLVAEVAAIEDPARQ